MRQRHRWIISAVIALCCVLCAGLFAGCGGRADGTDREDGPEAETIALSASSEHGPDAVSDDAVSADIDETAPVIWPLPAAQTGRPEEDTDRLRPNYTYELSEIHEVDGRQGIAWADG
ncbi:MAG: hypothetical protein IIZ51_06900, partial [Lachnospiraceae bacterium]|nr:hypothetical protein [Lachnospiraceae bacterium]